MDTQNTPIEEACEIVGSQAELARIMGVTPAMVNQLIKGHRPVPIEHCLAIERATDGRVTRQALRPDDFLKIWPDLAKADPVLKSQMAKAAKAGLIERRTGLADRRVKAQSKKSNVKVSG